MSGVTFEKNLTYKSLVEKHLGSSNLKEIYENGVNRRDTALKIAFLISGSLLLLFTIVIGTQVLSQGFQSWKFVLHTFQNAAADPRLYDTAVIGALVVAIPLLLAGGYQVIKMYRDLHELSQQEFDDIIAKEKIKNQ